MMLNDLLGELTHLGIKVWVNGEQLGINAPSGTLTPELRQALLEHKQQLLNLLKNQTATADLLPTLEPQPTERHLPFPLTDIQQAYWVGRKGSFELGDVGVHFYAEIEGSNLNVDRLTSAWQKVINRHEMLRAVVLSDGTQQILAEIPTYSIALLDLSNHTPEAAETELTALRRRMSHQLYSAETWPLFEIRASKLPSGRIRLHISMDILMVDGSAILTVLQEWVQNYKDPALTLPVPAVSFRDYMLAAQKIRQSELYERAKTYWFDRLDTLPPSPQLPVTANFNPAEQRFQRHSQELPAEVWRALKAQASQVGLTPSGILMATFAEVLTNWSKSAHFTLNMTLFNRLPLHPQVHEIIGDFTTINLLEVNNTTVEPFKSRALRLQKQLWQDLSHYYISGVEVIRELVRRRKDRMGAVMPVVFTSTLGIQDAKARRVNGDNGNGNGSNKTSDLDHPTPPPAASLEDLGEILYTISQTPQVWLDHTMRERSDGALVLSWDVVEGLFPAGLIEDMFAAYAQLLQRLATDTAVWTETNLCLTPASQLTERNSYNATAATVSNQLLHSLFITQARANPERLAVISADRTLTYGELYEEANQIGRWLRERGASPNRLVAVVMKKGWEQIVAVLGILFSGAAYLPIDPELPKERQHYLLDQGQVNLVLTQSHLAASLTWPDETEVLSLDTANLESVAPLSIVQKPTDLAYVIYTSGSTGLPKGVVIDHRGALNTCIDINRRFGITAQDRVLALSALNFDLSVYDIFGLLACGGAIVMPTAERRRDPAHWAELMTMHDVTLWDTVPALMQMLVDYQGGQPLAAPLKLVMMSGDWIPLDLPQRIKALWPQAQVMSLGGATEASIWSIYYPIDQTDPTWKSIPYGFPLTNQQFHVLNARLEPCPLWVPGDLYIGGIGLALGYWRDEAKTNASFIIHPDSGERLYKTGDLGRFVPDSHGQPVIEFLGREDFQVKIRGHRIELGEVEAALLQHSAVKEVVVNAVGDDRHNKQLVAYIVSDDTSMPAAQAKPVEKYTAQTGVLQDPVERLQFKLNQPGIRPSPESSVYLIAPEFDDTLKAAYLARQSYREFLSTPISLQDFSLFISCLLQMQLEDTPLPKYRYPSGGGLYPIQTYVYLKSGRVEGLEAGFYYYHPADHRLVLVHADASLTDSMYGQPGDTNHSIYQQAGFALFLVGHMPAIEPIYGQPLAEKLSLVEAGYMGQLLMTEAPQYQLGLCPIGDVVHFADLRTILGLTDSHTLLHSFLGGKIDPEKSRQWLQPPTTAPVGQSLESQLSEYLAEKVPTYMIPAAYLFLDALPLTPNGKVNRQALPTPESFATAHAGTFVAPRTPMEEQLVTIWGEVLKLSKIGVQDNFFDAGGDSLSATRIVTQIREIFQVELPIVTMFDNPTVATLVEQIEQLKATSEPTDTPPAASGKRKKGRL